MVFVIIVLAVMVARPDESALDAQLTEQLIEEAASLSVDDGDSVISGVMKVTCAINAEECARLIRATMEIETTDFYVMRRARVALVGEPALRCVGAVFRWTCWGVG